LKTGPATRLGGSTGAEFNSLLTWGYLNKPERDHTVIPDSLGRSCVAESRSALLERAAIDHPSRPKEVPGWLDLVVANSRSNSVSVFSNNTPQRTAEGDQVDSRLAQFRLTSASEALG